MQFSFIYSLFLFRPVDNVLCMMFTTTLVVLYADIWCFPCKIQLLYWFPVLLARLVGVYCRWMLMNLGKNLCEVHLNVKMWVLLFMDTLTVLLTIG